MITRLLLVDSDIGFMLKLKDALEQTGDFQVSVAGNTPGASEHLARAYHHCALVGFDLPAADIIKVLRDLRQVQPDLLVVVTPANNTEEDRVRFLSVQGTLRKPFTARDAAPYIERVVMRARQRPPIGAEDIHPPEEPAAPPAKTPRAPEQMPADLIQPPSAPARPITPGLDLDTLDRQHQPVEDYHAPDPHSILDEFAALESTRSEPAIPDPSSVDALDWFRHLDPLPPTESPADARLDLPSLEGLSVPRPSSSAPPPAPPPSFPAEVSNAEDLFDAIYSDANYADDIPLMPPEMPAFDFEPEERADAEPLPGAYGEPEIEPPDLNRTAYLGGAYGEPEITESDLDRSAYLQGAYSEPQIDPPPDLDQTAYLGGAYGDDPMPHDRNATAFLGDYDSGDYDSRGQDSAPYGTAGDDEPGFPPDDEATRDLDREQDGDWPERVIDDTRRLGQTAPLEDDWGAPDADIVGPFVLDSTGSDDTFRDVLEAVSGVDLPGDAAGRGPDDASMPPTTRELRDRAFHELVDSFRAPPDARPGRASLNEVMAALEQHNAAGQPANTIDHLLNAIRSGALPAKPDTVDADSAPEVSDSTIGELIQGLFDSAFEGVLATLAGEDVTDDSFHEPSYEGLEDEPPHRSLPEPLPSPDDSASYPATTALSAVRSGPTDSGEFSLDVLLSKIEADLPQPRRPRLKPLPSWHITTAPPEQAPGAHSIEAMFDHFEGVDHSLRPSEKARYESLLKEFENLTPESGAPADQARSSADDAPAQDEFLSYEEAEDDPFAQGDRAFAQRTPDQVAPPPASEDDWQEELWPDEQPAGDSWVADADYVPEMEIPSFVADYHLQDLQDSDTRPMPVDAGAHLDYSTAELAEFTEHEEFDGFREYDDLEEFTEPERFAEPEEFAEDRIPPELAAELGDLTEQLSAGPDDRALARPDSLPGWSGSPDKWALSEAADSRLVEVPADTAAMLLSGLDNLSSLEEPAHDTALEAALDTESEAGEDAEQEAGSPADQAAEQEVEDEALAEVAVLLTQYALESSAQAVMLARPGAVVALAGNLPETAERRLFDLVDTAWNAAPDSAALIRFITLPDTGEFLLYSTLVDSGDAGDLSLSMIFNVDTPVRVIRRQAQRLSESLALIPDEPDDLEPLTERTLVNRPTDLRAPSGLAEAVREHQAARESAAQSAAAQSAAEGAPVRPPDETVTTAFTCAWLLADPQLELRGALAEIVDHSLDVVARANLWQVEERWIGPDVVILTLQVPESLLADDVIARMMSAVSALTAEQIPDLLAEGESLWSDGYYLVSPPRALSDREIGRFINAQREAG